MEISHTFRLCLVNCTLCLFVGLLSARNSPVPSTLEGVPTDSILVLSLETRQLLSKSGVLTNAKWKPLLERFDGGALLYNNGFLVLRKAGLIGHSRFSFLFGSPMENTLIHSLELLPKQAHPIRQTKHYPNSLISSGFAHPRPTRKFFNGPPSLLLLGGRGASAFCLVLFLWKVHPLDLRPKMR